MPAMLVQTSRMSPGLIYRHRFWSIASIAVTVELFTSGVSPFVLLLNYSYDRTMASEGKTVMAVTMKPTLIIGMSCTRIRENKWLEGRNGRRTSLQPSLRFSLERMVKLKLRML